jgi:glucose/arabinose dehydrogenase
VVRFTFSADFRTADPASATPILTILQAADSSHKAGSIHFDNDGMMRIAIGDGAGANDPANNAQNPLVLSGKILRIDPSTDGQPGDPDQHYTIPADNPFAGSSDVRPEIWAFGVRNPFRWTYDSASGASIIADVGQDAREELNFEPASRSGRNYGWPQREGAAATAHPGTPRPGPIQEPWFDWGRSDGRSVIGGFVYCGGDLGEFTRYLFGDFSLGVIRSVEVRTDSAGEALPAGISATKRHRTQDALNGLVAIKPDALGEPVIVEMFSGRVSRLVAE